MIETLKREEKLLRKIISISKKYSDKKVPITVVKNGLDNYYLNQLISHKLVQLDYLEQDKEGSPLYEYLSVTNEGNHFFEKKRAEIKRFLFRSILTPIVVSSLTTLLTLFITWLVKTAIAK